eukprot:TRINITY_DN32963_c0_g1_i1.p1 TRINITY_DN32963_c0_g1~~TRINITY_DN32963_c0_g1_i1.p1  ORF type:complete len:304 (+),score=54.27 TRINITY_DN32963_c0_g1_i1:34-945(+)
MAALRALRASLPLRSAADAFTLFEHSRWQAAVSPYDRIFGRLTQQAASHVVKHVQKHAAMIEPGTKGLDCATGPGYVIEEALRHGFRGEDLVGADFSSAMLQRAKERIPNRSVSWIEADIQQQFSQEHSGGYGWCSCNFGVLHLGNPDAFFSAARKVLRPGGVLVFTVWSALDRSPAFQIPLKAIQKHGSVDVGLPDGPPFFKYSDESESRTALINAGFDSDQIRIEELDMQWILDQPEDLWEAFLEGTARTGGLLERQAPSAKEAIRQAMHEALLALQPSSSSVPPYILRQPCILVSAKTPV